MFKSISVLVFLVSLLAVAVVHGDDGTLELSWRDAGRNELLLVGPQTEVAARNCLDGGLIISYTFQAERCASRSWWADSCRVSLEQEGRLYFDKIQERFISEVDVLGDGRPARRLESELFEDAMLAVRSASIRFSRERRPGDYLLVKADIECRSAGGSTIQELVNILTLGAVSPQVFDTGWIRYNLG